MQSEQPITFQAVLQGIENTAAALLPIPFDAHAVFGVRGRIPVRGTVNGVSFRSSIFPGRDSAFQHIVLPRAVREAAQVQAGDRVEVTLMRDDEPRDVVLPPELAEALQANPVAQQAWEQLSYTRRTEQVRGLTSVKRPETRTRKIHQLVALLVAGGKPGRK